MKGVTSDLAAKAVIRACRDKFPTDQPAKPGQRLPADAVGRVTGGLSIQNGYLFGTMYNGNEKWTITEVTVLIVPKGEVPWTKEAVTYRIRTNIEPLTNATISSSVTWKEGRAFEWQILEAAGFQ